MSHNITVEGGTSVRLPTAGKYCDRDIVITAEGGKEDLEEVLTEQEALIATLQDNLRGKASGGGGGSDFPGGYNRVDYIKFTGEQYVDTGIVCNQDTKLRTLFTRDGNASQYVYGVNNSGNTKAITAYLGADSAAGSWRFGNQRVTKSIATYEDIVQCAIARKTSLTTGSGASAYSSVSDFETIGSLVIGGCRFEDGIEEYTKFDGKIYSMQIWQSGELALKLIPAVSADGVYGFWDEVGQQFLTSATDIPLNGGEE